MPIPYNKGKGSRRIETITTTNGFLGPDGERLRIGDKIVMRGMANRTWWQRIRSGLSGYGFSKSDDGIYVVTSTTTAKRINT